MGYGYALLPTKDEMTRPLTFRLSPGEKKERDEWIMGAVNHGFTISEIAVEVGLTENRVKEIIKEKTKAKKPVKIGKFDSPLAAARYEYENEVMHAECRKSHAFICNSCWGDWTLIECGYDDTGWPYDWAWYGQEKYIAQSNPRPN